MNSEYCFVFLILIGFGSLAHGAYTTSILPSGEKVFLKKLKFYSAKCFFAQNWFQDSRADPKFVKQQSPTFLLHILDKIRNIIATSPYPCSQLANININTTEALDPKKNIGNPKHLFIILTTLNADIEVFISIMMTFMNH